MLSSRALVGEDTQQSQQQAAASTEDTTSVRDMPCSSGAGSPTSAHAPCDSVSVSSDSDMAAFTARSSSKIPGLTSKSASSAPSVRGESSSSFFSTLIADNPIFSGGLGLMVFGGALAIIRRGTKVAASTAQRRLLISLEIPSKDRAHPWFLHWMAAQARAQSMRERGLLGKPRKEGLVEFLGLRDRSASLPAPARPGSSLHRDKVRAKGSASSRGTHQHNASVHDPLTIASTGDTVSPVRILSHELSVETSYKPHASASTPNAQAAERGTARFSLVPGPGTHWFRYKGVWMRLTRERDGKMVDLSTGAPWETVTLTTLFAYAHLFPQLLDEARQLALASTEGKTVIYTSWGPEWRPFGQPRRTRELGSVVLGKGKKETIVGDVKRFLERGSWYAERGIPYRRGYLLHGAPGSGKSSFITALAGHLDFNICLLNLSERGLTDDKLNHLLSNAPDRSILLLEDVDAAFLGRQQAAEDGYQASVTFSGLLNALDGVASGESRIIFMTTNHIERLDPALIRPGRVDMIAELGDAEKEQVEELMIRFYRATLREQRMKKALNTSDKPSQQSSQIDNVDIAEAAAPLAGEAIPAKLASADPLPDLSGTPTLAEAIASADREIQQLASSFSAVVESEAAARRGAIGLDPSGRSTLRPATPSPAASPSSASSTSARSVRPLPAASGGVSMAELQGLFIRFPDEPHAAVEAFVQECKVRGEQQKQILSS
ncbi:hypothetical protein BCV70DRAFT_199523 [Testicularia cyperi]|uniref:Uncharacterized protein n=1 Tax=Testicularia cyperi TaxID=1882483 RepID=A0A317XS56_9BASI|nr:hypothetical protein BCV70DRAFT_199523 [Testicularia cyperi]